jgi:hypothetical protein
VSGSAAGSAIGALLTVMGFVGITVGVVAGSLALGGGSFLAESAFGVAAAAVLVGLAMLALGGTLLWGLQ